MRSPCKTSLAGHFADAACRRGERCLYLAFEESQGQILRNMRSIGLDLGRWTKAGLLHFQLARPTVYGFEMHLVQIHKLVEQLRPDIVVIDPMSGLLAAGSPSEVHSMMLRLIDYLKQRGVTALLTSLTSNAGPLEQTDYGVSSLVDAWLVLKDLESDGERNRALHVLKTRGMSHSNQVREFLLTDHGIELRDVYLGPGAVLVGSARLAQESRERAAGIVRQQDAERKRRDAERRRAAMEAQIAAIRADFDAEAAETSRAMQEDARREVELLADDERMKRSRSAEVNKNGAAGKAR